MSQNASTIIITAAEMQQRFQMILSKEGFTPERAEQCAAIFTDNSVDGIYTHGVNRFPVFVKYIKEGIVRPNAEPTLLQQFAAIAQWNGNLGPGPLNAVHAANNAMELASKFGIGCVSLSNTNHWMRAGYYGWQAARKGYILIAWTNTTALMPAWGATDAKLGNNPLLMALPYKDQAIVLDMAMSQFSFGAMEQQQMIGGMLKVPGGFDKNGNLTNDPSAILHSKRPLPVGYWKGAGLALLLDLLATILSAGLATHEISGRKKEYGLSQVFIAIDPAKLGNYDAIATVVQQILDDYHSADPIDNNDKIIYPGQHVLQTRKHNLENGIPVLEKVWNEIVELSA